MSITAMQVSRARFSTIAQTFVEDAISLLREAVVAAAEFVGLWPDAGGLGTRKEDTFFGFFAGGSRILSMSTGRFMVRYCL